MTSINNFILVHIGKCGGSTVRKELEENQINCLVLHTANVPFYKSPEIKYIIVIRNPVERFISAYFWRYYLVCVKKEQATRFIGEKEFLEKHNTIELLIDKIKNEPTVFDTNYVHHIHENIHFYLENFIDICPNDKIIGVMLQETLDNDMDRMFNIKVKSRQNNNSENKQQINYETRSIIKSHLKKDYLMIEKMFKKGWITKNQYDILNV